MLGFIRWATFLSPIVAVGIWSSEPAIQTMFAVISFPGIRQDSEEISDHKTFSLTTIRNIQQHFRKYNTHILPEDILFRSAEHSYQEKIFLLLDRSCGHGNVYVWVPLIFRFPFVGNRVTEWCWIPKAKTGKN